MPAADLRPMSLGEVLDRTFSLYKNNFWLFAGIMFLPYLVYFIFQVGLGAFTTGLVSPGSAGAPPVPHGGVPSGGAIAGLLGGGLIFLVLFLALTAAAQAATIFAVSDLYLGRTASVRGAFRRVRGKVMMVIGVTLLVALIVGIGTILLIIPGIILACRTAVAVPVAMLEDETPMSSVNRSMALTKGHAWQIFLIYVLVIVMGWIIQMVFQVPFLIAAGSSLGKAHALSFGATFLNHLGEFIGQVLVGPVGTIAFSLMYYNLRVQKEAFDLQHLMTLLGPSSAPGAQLPGAPSPV